jgi:hypothetical protein
MRSKGLLENFNSRIYEISHYLLSIKKNNGAKMKEMGLRFKIKKSRGVNHVKKAIHLSFVSKSLPVFKVYRSSFFNKIEYIT